MVYQSFSFILKFLESCKSFSRVSISKKGNQIKRNTVVYESKTKKWNSDAWNLVYSLACYNQR